MQKKRPGEGLLKISEFAKIAEVSRKGLIFYDNTGVFSPEYTAPNGYRYYAHEQIYLISVVNLLRELDTPLHQIRDYMRDSTPGRAVELLEQQGERLARKIEALQGIRDMLQVKLSRLERGREETEDIRVVEQEEMPLFLSDPFEEQKDQVSDDIWVGFYTKCRERGIAFGYPEGFLVRHEDLRAGRTNRASHIICHVGARKYANGCMPAGRYLALCGRGSFGDTEPLYQRLLDYAARHGLTVTGDGYEERLIDEIAAEDREEQRIEVKLRIG